VKSAYGDKLSDPDGVGESMPARVHMDDGLGCGIVVAMPFGSVRRTTVFSQLHTPRAQ
jgi:hypothetical protein